MAGVGPPLEQRHTHRCIFKSFHASLQRGAGAARDQRWQWGRSEAFQVCVLLPCEASGGVGGRCRGWGQAPCNRVEEGAELPFCLLRAAAALVGTSASPCQSCRGSECVGDANKRRVHLLPWSCDVGFVAPPAPCRGRTRATQPTFPQLGGDFSRLRMLTREPVNEVKGPRVIHRI